MRPLGPEARLTRTPDRRSGVRRAAQALLALALHVSAPDVRAQSECEPCLTIVPVAELSTADGPIVPSRNQSVFRTANGRFLVSHRFVDPPQLAVYDSNGRFLQLYERAGSGPGEFRRSPELFPGPENTIWALDQERVVVLDGELRHIRTLNLQRRLLVSRVILRDDGSVLISSRDPATQPSVSTVGLTDTAWAVSRTFERGQDAYGILIAPAADGGFWSLTVDQLLLRKYSERGDLVRSIPLELESFREARAAEPGEGMEGFDFPSRPLHSHLVVAGTEHIVLLTRVPGSEWKRRPSDQMFRPSEEDDNQLYDTIITLVDTRSGEIVGRRRVPEYLKEVSGAWDLFHTTRMDPDGHVITRVLRLDVRIR